MPASIQSMCAHHLPGAASADRFPRQHVDDASRAATPSRWVPLEDKLAQVVRNCPVHSLRTRQLRQAWQQGRSPANRLQPGRPKEFPAPKSAADLRDLLADSIVGIRSGKLDPKLANSISYLGAGFLRALGKRNQHSRSTVDGPNLLSAYTYDVPRRSELDKLSTVSAVSSAFDRLRFDTCAVDGAQSSADRLQFMANRGWATPQNIFTVIHGRSLLGNRTAVFCDGTAGNNEVVP